MLSANPMADSPVIDRYPLSLYDTMSLLVEHAILKEEI